MAGQAFMSSQMGAHGQSRDARGNLRFNRNTNRAREQERGMDVDVDQALEDMGHGDKKKMVERRKKRQAMGTLGDEFRAKVRTPSPSHPHIISSRHITMMLFN